MIAYLYMDAFDLIDIMEKTRCPGCERYTRTEEVVSGRQGGRQFDTTQSTDRRKGRTVG